MEIEPDSAATWRLFNAIETNAIVRQINARDIALAFWLSVGLVLMLRQPSIRASLKNILSALIEPKIMTVFALLGIYITMVIAKASKFGLWDISLLKDTVYWLLGTATALVMNARHPTDLKKAVMGAVRVAVLLEFILNIYVFPLPVELMLLPVLTMLFAMAAFSDIRPGYDRVKKIISVVLSLLGVVLIVNATLSIVIDFADFASGQHVRELMLQPLLTVALMPFLYGLALLTTYEVVFMRVTFWARHGRDRERIGRAIKWRIIRRCGLSLAKLDSVSMGLPKALYISLVPNEDCIFDLEIIDRMANNTIATAEAVEAHVIIPSGPSHG
jgi:hypothetical protein